ncbi:hypothetical protein ACQPZJ_21430 [Actinoplanes sp. CA-054009]
MNPFYFEIVRGRAHRYSWQLVTYFGGDRRVIARSHRDWSTADEARDSAEATQQAVCGAQIVTKPAQPGDIHFEVLEDVLALEVTGHGDFDDDHDHDHDHDHHDGDGNRPATVTPAKSAPAPVARAEAGKSNGEARPKARPRKTPAKTTRAGASRS